MDFENLAKTWDCFGKTDPLWSILTEADKKGNKWDTNEFFHRGELEIQLNLHLIGQRHTLKNCGRSLDFGCGVGRLTQALASRFEESHGLDISEAMIEHANEFKSARQVTNSHFHLNKENDLNLFKDDYFDFIISLIVLQHMEPRYFSIYIEEFCRIIKKGGLIVFQLPVTVENRADYEIFTEDTDPVMEIFGMEKDDVVQLVENNGGRIVDIASDSSFGKELEGYKYYITK